ncbi:unnamed protein product, partial [Nesidiocoris tenuis]
MSKRNKKGVRNAPTEEDLNERLIPVEKAIQSLSDQLEALTRSLGTKLTQQNAIPTTPP